MPIKFIDIIKLDSFKSKTYYRN